MFKTFAGQDVLGYLSLYVEPAHPGASLVTAHPVDLVLDAFVSGGKLTMNKLRVFLEEALKMHNKTMTVASPPDPLKDSWFIF